MPETSNNGELYVDFLAMCETRGPYFVVSAKLFPLKTCNFLLRLSLIRTQLHLFVGRVRQLPTSNSTQSYPKGPCSHSLALKYLYSESVKAKVDTR